MERGNPLLKFFDAQLGPILIQFLRPFRLLTRNRMPAEPRAIGIIKTAAIGDTILISAIISDIRSKFPKAKVVLFVGSSNFEFSKLLGGIDEVVKLPLKNPFKAFVLLRSQKIDVCIDTDSWPRISAIFALITGAYTIGFKTSGQRRHHLFNIQIDHSSQLHELDNYRSLLNPLKVKSKSLPQDLGFAWSEAETERYVTFHMWPGGTRSFLKEWDRENWFYLAERLTLSNDLQIKLTGGKENREPNENFIASAPDQIRSKLENCAGISFKDTLKILQRSQGLISVNTGIMHVGAALGLPTLGLHGPTSPLRWGPVGPRVAAIASASPLAGKLNLGFEYETDEILMNSISVDQVVETYENLIDRHHQAQK